MLPSGVTSTNRQASPTISLTFTPALGSPALASCSMIVSTADEPHWVRVFQQFASPLWTTAAPEPLGVDPELLTHPTQHGPASTGHAENRLIAAHTEQR